MTEPNRESEIERTSRRLKQIENASDIIADAAESVQQATDELRHDIDVIYGQQEIQDVRLDDLEETNGTA